MIYYILVECEDFFSNMYMYVQIFFPKLSVRLHHYYVLVVYLFVNSSSSSLSLSSSSSSSIVIIIINHIWPIIIIFAGLYSLVAGQGGKSSAPAYTTALETALRTEIFTGYSHLQRPMKQVQVNTELTLLTVNDLVSIKRLMLKYR